ncbi:LysM peptidoglycan-binding domain-containing protein [Psychromonas antarctica]|uniref:LysM peptidoglycan-binding domain-containing protein n=1 Tax=Psychromonas antarctica TaxID=67573 RepID=UPI001EE862A1|nr:LysM peptidoglycan-binding domain-containing protein [Psychromonas antarctica]MCG6200718.1 LysM peptidoglycan-binding domain-containing protein [Psychromonas antarctica]
MKFKLISAFLLGVALSIGAFADQITLKENHPETYTVVKGDTLWDISAHFLNTPWLWPRLWQANSQVANPHLIYPGDVLTLIWVDGEPKLARKQLKKLSPTPRLVEKSEAIPAISLAAISAFLSKDHIIDPALLADAPRLLGDAIATPRFFEGDVFYGQGKYDKNKLYGVYRLGERYRDPVTAEFLGTELTFIGNSQVSKNPNVTATSKITPHDFLKSAREARQGDLILPIPEYESMPAFFLPQPVPASTQGQILAALNNARAIGKWDVVVINKGKREKIQIGSMFSILQSGPGVLVNKNNIVYHDDADKFAQLSDSDLVIPAERVGELMVFKVYEKVSIALVMRSTNVMGAHYKIQGLEF